MTSGSLPAPAPAAPSPYDAPELYDLMLDTFDFDMEYWLGVARDAHGPVLDVGCGTGRVLLRLLDAGADADGLDNSPAMLRRAGERAAAAGHEPALVLGDMRDFTAPRHYARAICAFNAFAHCETTDDQLRALGRIREHLAPGGALVLHMSYPRPAYWTEPDGVPVLELEKIHPGNGHTLQMWDTRTKDPVGQYQHSRMEIRETDQAGEVVASHFSETRQRWIYRFEMELLLRVAGFDRWEIFGEFNESPFERPDQQMIAWGWCS